jgi:hypothetical protein
MATVGTPDHNKRLPLASASFEPHHDRGLNGLAVRYKDHPNKGEPGTSRAKPAETPTLRTQTSRNPHIINQARRARVSEDWRLPRVALSLPVLGAVGLERHGAFQQSPALGLEAESGG